MAYINRKNTEDAIRKYADTKHSNGEQIEYVNGILKSISVISEQPSADVVEVVRCGNCKHCEKVIDQFDNDWYFCKKTVDNAEVTASHYCGYGERRDT